MAIRFKGLFTPLRVGNVEMPNRIVMAPMCRYRVHEDGTANALVAQYFAQRASAGLIVCEGGYVHPTGRLAPEVGGIVTERQIESWRRVTDAVHDAGGRIFMQLMHSGRVSHPNLQPDGGAPWAPSAIRPDGDMVRSRSNNQVEPTPTPREMTIDEIRMIIKCFGQATESAYRAGFDGVELHAGNGYLPHQFLASGTNLRTDDYGGTIKKRSRFVMEVMQEMIGIRGPEFVSMKVSPITTHHDTHEKDAWGAYDYLLREFNAFKNIAYLTVQSIMDFVQPAPPEFDVFSFARERYEGTLFAAANLDRYAGEGLITSDTADAVVYGRRFVANPDLVERFASNAQESLVNWGNVVQGGAEGYTDYPFLDH